MSVIPVVTDKTASETKPLKMTYEEFLAWADEDSHAEWENGEVIIPMPAKNPHQTLLEFLFFVIEAYIRVLDLGRVRTPPFELKLSATSNSREPDLMFIATEHLDRLTYDRVNDAPDLIIEIISDDSVTRDRVTKFDEYEAGGVPEYWILDNRPGRNRAQFFQLDGHGQYQPVPVGTDGIYRSRVLPGFWLKVDWLWDEQPNVLRAIAAVIGPERMFEALKRAAE